MPGPSASSLRSVESFFSRRSLGASREWICACAEFCLSEGIGTSNDDALSKACLDQWLSTDLRDKGVQVRDDSKRLDVDTVRREVKAAVPKGAYTVQVLSAVNVSTGAYGQLQKLQNAGANRVDNSTVSAFVDDGGGGVGSTASSYSRGTQFVPAWQPKGSRMLKLTLTDGFDVFQALEDRHISSLPDPVPAGLKLTLFGPLTARRGLLLLRPESVRVHGGHVPEVEAAWTRQQDLRARLGKLEPNHEYTGDPSLVRTHPTGTFVPKKIPVKYKPNARLPPPARNPARPLATSRSVNAQNSIGEEDDFDSLLSQIPMPEGSGVGASGDFFEDDDDGADLFLSQVDLSAVEASKRRRF